MCEHHAVPCFFKRSEGRRCLPPPSHDREMDTGARDPEGDDHEGHRSGEGTAA